VAAFLLVRNIQGQPSSAVPEGGQLILALAWVGTVYGTLDGLLLNVVPVLAVQGSAFYETPQPWRKRLVLGLFALGASILLTVAYHAGYTEFRGPKIISAVIGNTIITVSYLLTGSPLAAVASHAVMHCAAVLHGMETVLQLPPHYGP